jgi:hypothetical protein
MKQIHSLYQVSEKPLSRRSWLRAAGCGFGYLSLSALLADEFKALAAAQDNPLAPRTPHFEPKAKRVIFLFMHGGPSSIDTFDRKSVWPAIMASRCPSNARSHSPTARSAR